MTEPSTDSPALPLQTARCTLCHGYSYPATVPGCRVCGAPPEALTAETCAGPVELINFVTLHSPLAPGLDVPCVIGEVRLAPGLIEEALIAVADESVLRPGMSLWPEPRPSGAGWQFRPEAA